MGLVSRKRNTVIPLAVKVIASIVLMIVFVLGSIKLYNICAPRNMLFLYREALMTAAFAFAMLNVFIRVDVLYSFIFKYRYAIGVLLIGVLVLAKINFSSIAMLDKYVQPGMGSEFISPIFGDERAIRSDEWAVSTPRALTYQYCAGEKYNDIIMATQTPNISASNISASLAILVKPFHIGYLFLNVEYASSLYWCSALVFSYLFVMEAFLVFTKNKPLMSVAGATLVVFSQFFLWWSGVLLISFGMAAVAFIYRFVNAEKSVHRLLYGVLVAIFGASFVCTLYPAWLVPLGYTFLAVIIWIIIDRWKKIKSFKAIDWIIFAGTLIFAVAIIGVYLLSQTEYVAAVTATVYPGKRFENGGFSLRKLFKYVPSLKYPFAADGFVVSEETTFFSLYPIPTLYAIYMLFRRKKKDILSIFLMLVSIFLTVYCTVGVPDIIAKYTMMSSSTAARAVDVLSFIQIPLLFRNLAIAQDENIGIPLYISIPSAIAVSVITVCIAKADFPIPDYMSMRYMIIIGAFIAFLIIALLHRNQLLNKAALVLFTAVILITGLRVWPIQKGLDPIYSKPVAVKIAEIAEDEPDSRWIAVDQWVEANFYAACGAKVINSNNYIPNIKMWETLFPDKQYEEIYNRYSNMIICLTDKETYPYLNQPDLITLFLNVNDFEKLGIDYIVSKRILETPGESDVGLNEIYAEGAIYIYEVEYS